MDGQSKAANRSLSSSAVEGEGVEMMAHMYDNLPQLCEHTCMVAWRLRLRKII